ncbi:unnamed protein product [Clonostachys rosea f. rosea IK726]|uniref:Uncharacterized protein n=1 Tax=Clonostachys rosea f. rosea IK726 TaxID=1349383 RepID=A0ACA9UZM8_BIOOC|nr:unnamed protein product [Clonostachys rosea f. rosea IK726]
MPNTSLRARPAEGLQKRRKACIPWKITDIAASSRAEGTSADEKWERTRQAHSIDQTMGFARFESGKKKEGWLVNVQPTSIEDERIPAGRAALDCYFLEEDGNYFKATVEYEPYSSLQQRGATSRSRRMGKESPRRWSVKSVKKVEKDDLDMPNHLMVTNERSWN